MADLSRRSLITGAAVVGAAAAASVAPSAARAAAQAAATPTPGRYGDLRDIKHVVILMQENRSFDMYFGTLKGVIGYGDKATITLPGGYSVFQQPLTPPGQTVTGTQYPFSFSKGAVTTTPLPPDAEQGAQNANGTDHSWPGQHGSWYGGLMNGWYATKGIEALGYFTRDDIPVPEPNPVEDGNADNLALAIKTDVLAGKLPQVSWVVTNQQTPSTPTARRPTVPTTSARQ